jgi:hypothetical protein
VKRSARSIDELPRSGGKLPSGDARNLLPAFRRRNRHGLFERSASMIRIAAATPVIALVAALAAAPVLGQAPGAKPQAAPARAQSAEKAPAMKDEAKPAARKRAPSLAVVDARHCLQLATNMAIHQCAEKYRPR